MILLAGLLTGCASLPREQMIYEASYQALHVIDTAQTLRIRHKVQFHESNPILGRYPSDAEVLGVMAAEAIAHAYVTKLLADRNAPMWAQRTWHHLSIAWNGRLVLRNNLRGL
jgi:hypothetical protein